MTRPVGAVETGGTKTVCAVGTGPADLVAETFPTTAPAETLARIVAWFRERDIAALGVASFGPVGLDPGSPTWGHVTTTPKPGWPNTDVAGALGRALGVPVAFETDVNAAALAEHRWGAAQDVDTLVYLTVGTGIGGGVLVGGRPVHGAMHPEMGHLLLARDAGDSFAGVCPFHGDCWEGLASGPAIQARWGARAETLPPDHPAWPVQARALARGVVTILAALSPERIVMGGGVMQAPPLLPRVRAEVARLNAGYLPVPDDLDGFIVAPGLGDRSGVLGALALAKRQQTG